MPRPLHGMKYILQNVGEDTDEMFDGLFKKYGKVVFRRNDQKPPSAEVDDDAESLSCKLSHSHWTLLAA